MTYEKFGMRTLVLVLAVNFVPELLAQSDTAPLSNRMQITKWT